MKRIIASITVLATITVFTGCYKHDTSLCRVDENCVLLFELEATSGGTDFTSTVHSIDVALFDSEGNFVTHQRVEKAALDEFQGLRLSVNPGTYHVVAWGNVSQCSELSTRNGSSPTGFNASTLRTVSNQTGCNLYYAPSKPVEKLDPTGNTIPDYSLYRVEVVANEVTRKELDFVRANRRVYVYLKDFDANTEVELERIPDQYDYYLRAHGTRKNYRQATQPFEYEQTGEVLQRASFHAPIVPFEDEMMLTLVETTTRADKTIRSISLKDWYEANKAQIPDINRLSILCTKGASGDISFTVANWQDDQVKPIW